MTAPEFLRRLHARLKDIHDEDPDRNYMRKLNEIADHLEKLEAERMTEKKRKQMTTLTDMIYMSAEQLKEVINEEPPG